MKPQLHRLPPSEAPSLCCNAVLFARWCQYVYNGAEILKEATPCPVPKKQNMLQNHLEAILVADVALVSCHIDTT